MKLTEKQAARVGVLGARLNATDLRTAIAAVKSTPSDKKSLKAAKKALLAQVAIIDKILAIVAPPRAPKA